MRLTIHLVMLITAAFHARARSSFPNLGGLQETKMFLPYPQVKLSIVRSLRDREVACSASDLQGLISNSVSEGQCHLTHLTILAQFSLYVHKKWCKARFFGNIDINNSTAH